jgi:acyl dehydratase|tara:strand:+ start:32 stop:508 length:477 start_codon:yes stop_codon:yes gene_type:complete
MNIIIDKTFGNYFNDFKTGEIIQHFVGKTVTESDNNLFSLLTMNHHPLHLDVEYARKTQHGKIIVVGTYVFSLVVGLTVPDISGKAIANLGYEKITHDGPVFIGDTIYAETEILDVRESKSKPDRGIVYVETRAFNQHKERIMTFRRHVLVPKKGREK